MPSGGSLAIAGLISDSTRQNIDGLPGLKDLPVLGTLFRSRDFTKAETELVVIVTPFMVRPPRVRTCRGRTMDGHRPRIRRPTSLVTSTASTARAGSCRREVG
jgi:pilus assembly protein CpaC